MAKVVCWLCAPTAHLEKWSKDEHVYSLQPSFLARKHVRSIIEEHTAFEDFRSKNVERAPLAGEGLEPEYVP